MGLNFVFTKLRIVVAQFFYSPALCRKDNEINI